MGGAHAAYDKTTGDVAWETELSVTGAPNGQLNRIYYEPRCHEGNLGMVGLLQGNRAVERAFAEGRGPHPASLDISSNSNTLGTGSNDPLRGDADLIEEVVR